MAIPPSPFERRQQLRRSVDQAADNLHKTFSTNFYHPCLEHKADGVLLLDNEIRVIYATTHVDQIMKRQDSPFVIAPKFALHHPNHAARFATFVNGKNQEFAPLSLLLEGKNGRDQLLLNCFQFLKPAHSGEQAAHYLITLFDPNHYPTRNWLLFIKQFNLTSAEERLCRTLADGLTLNEYCKKWKVATSTARSQLHNVFGKTSTKRQTDLLRLIFLFSRT
jgi:DNA-binding CsgD family transcriptional regulator